MEHCTLGLWSTALNLFSAKQIDDLARKISLDFPDPKNSREMDNLNHIQSALNSSSVYCRGPWQVLTLITGVSEKIDLWIHRCQHGSALLRVSLY